MSGIGEHRLGGLNVVVCQFRRTSSCAANAPRGGCWLPYQCALRKAATIASICSRLYLGGGSELRSRAARTTRRRYSLALISGSLLPMQHDDDVGFHWLWFGPSRDLGAVLDWRRVLQQIDLLDIRAQATGPPLGVFQHQARLGGSAIGRTQRQPLVLKQLEPDR
jgi:hypothetical protein